MPRIPSLCALLLLLSPSLVGCDAEPAPLSEPVQAEAPPVQAIDPEPVTAENLLEKERYWPYRVAIRESHAPGEGKPTVQAGRIGVLIRVEPSGNPRIDFGSYGNWEIPVANSDIVERANRIRLGEEPKQAPNFTYAIRTRMLSSEAPKPVAVPAAWANERNGFLCIFADPKSPDFDALAQALAPLADRYGVGTILFPQGQVADADVHARLRALDWKVPFLADFLSEPYTMTLLPEGRPWPWLLLQTAEGTVALEGPLSVSALPELEAALDRRFGRAAS